jgi:probable rRNA maturation factor
VLRAPAPAPPSARRLLPRVARRALSLARWGGGAVEITLVDDEALRRVHARFLADATCTDVLAFDYRASGGPPQRVGGEVLVSLDCARREARRRGHDVVEELALYVAHGCLHLGGLRDETRAEAERMRRAERRALEDAGVACRFFPTSSRSVRRPALRRGSRRGRFSP